MLSTNSHPFGAMFFMFYRVRLIYSASGTPSLSPCNFHFARVSAHVAFTCPCLSLCYIQAPISQPMLLSLLSTLLSLLPMLLSLCPSYTPLPMSRPRLHPAPHVLAHVTSSCPRLGPSSQNIDLDMDCWRRTGLP